MKSETKKQKLAPGHLGLKPHWLFAIVSEKELHERITALAEKRAKELACFGGK